MFVCDCWILVESCGLHDGSDCIDGKTPPSCFFFECILIYCDFQIPPGDFVTVSLKGAGLNPASLNRGDSLNGQACGVIFQDALQGIVAGDGSSGSRVQILPSSVPSSLYCSASSSGGSPTSRYMKGFMSRHMATIDAVCMCRLGAAGAM